MSNRAGAELIWGYIIDTDQMSEEMKEMYIYEGVEPDGIKISAFYYWDELVEAVVGIAASSQTAYAERIALDEQKMQVQGIWPIQLTNFIAENDLKIKGLPSWHLIPSFD